MKREDELLNLLTLKERSHHLFTLSARSQSALRQAVINLGNHLDLEPHQSLGDLAYTLHVGREVYDYCLTLTAGSRGELKDLCQRVGARKDVLDLHVERKNSPFSNKNLKIAFVFTGQGSQFSGMGYEIYKCSSTVRHIFDECFEILKPYYPLPFYEYMFNPNYRKELDQIHISSIAMFMIEYALATMWLSWGIQPDIVIGHSLGEYAAACIAGGLSLRDALLTLVKRGYLMQEETEKGAMLSINGPLESVEKYLSTLGKDISIAAINGPYQHVVGGRREVIEHLNKQLEEDNVVHRLLPISTASHSVLMEPILDRYHKYLQKHTTFQQIKIPLVTNLTGKIVLNQVLNGDYWCKHLRETVQFANGIETLISEEVNIFLEVGPHPVLKTLVESITLDDEQLVLASMNRKEPQWKTIQESLGKLWAIGAEIDWKTFDQDYPRKRVHAPTYPFELRPCWNSVEKSTLHQMREVAATSIETSQEKKRENKDTRNAFDERTTEEWVRSIWREVLGVATVSWEDNFLDLGGESLHLIQVQSRIRKGLRLQINLSDLYKFIKFRDLVMYIEGLREIDGETQEMRTVPTMSMLEPVVGSVPLSHIQQMVFETPEINPEFFFMPICLETNKEIHPERLELSLKLLHDHHDMLRASFQKEGNDVYQTILSPKQAEIKLEVYDLSNCEDEQEREKTYYQIELRLAGTIKFNGGLINRAALFKLSENSYRVLWIVSHLYSDNVTNNILTQDLIETYEKLEKGIDATLKEKSSSYREWIENCRTFVNSEYADEARSYWIKKLREMDEYRILLDDPHSSKTYEDLCVSTLTFDADTTLKFRTEATSINGTTVKEVLFAIVSRSLAKWLDREQVMFSINGHGRDILHPEFSLDLSRTVGYFVNNYPFHIKIEKGESIVKTISQIGNQLNDMPHKGASYNMFRYLSNNPNIRETFANLQPLDILFNYHGEQDNITQMWGDWRQGGAGFLEQPKTNKVPFKLLLLSYIKNGRLFISFNYSGQQLKKDSIDRLKNLFGQEVKNTISESLLSLKSSK
jgi:non-ribosomal peptide synthase protein (TIGR01720 family)